MIKAGVSKKLPAAIGQWTKASVQPTGSDGVIYEQGTHTVIVGFLSDATYDSMAANITKNQTKATTGSCGSTSVESNLVCYLRAADGVVNVSADAGETPLTDLVSFANELSSTLGTQ